MTVVFVMVVMRVRMPVMNVVVIILRCARHLALLLHVRQIMSDSQIIVMIVVIVLLLVQVMHRPVHLVPLQVSVVIQT